MTARPARQVATRASGFEDRQPAVDPGPLHVGYARSVRVGAPLPFVVVLVACGGARTAGSGASEVDPALVGWGELETGRSCAARRVTIASRDLRWEIAPGEPLFVLGMDATHARVAAMPSIASLTVAVARSALSVERCTVGAPVETERSEVVPSFGPHHVPCLFNAPASNGVRVAVRRGAAMRVLESRAGWRRVVVGDGASTLSGWLPPAPAATPEPVPATEAALEGPTWSGHHAACGFPGAPEPEEGAAPMTDGVLGARAGSLQKEDIRRQIRANIEDVAACYDLALGRWRDAAGRLVLRFIVGPTGQVVSVEVAESALPRFVGHCIAHRMQAWTFPPPMGGGIVVVNYPFALTASD